MKKLAARATNLSSHMVAKLGSTVPGLATILVERREGIMTKLESYQMAMHQAKLMLKKGIITDKDYAKIENKMADKYCIKKGSIYRLNGLLLTPFRVIDMCDEREV